MNRNRPTALASKSRKYLCHDVRIGSFVAYEDASNARRVYVVTDWNADNSFGSFTLRAIDTDETITDNLRSAGWSMVAK